MELYKNMSYNEIVSLLIRDRYSIDDELALHRQKESKPDEFLKYSQYCEECKVLAKKYTQSI